MLRENTQILTLTLVPVLFTLFYIVPGAVLISNSLAKEKRLENIAFAMLLSLVFAPLTLTLLGRVVPGNDSLLMAGYVSFWALAIIGIRIFPATVKAWLPDFSVLPRADTVAWLVSILLTVIIVSVRLPIFAGFASLIDDDIFHMAKLSSIAATGLPSLYSRQPLYQFIYFDLDYILPALWTRYTDGAMGMALAWVVHIGIQTFVISLFQTRLIYMFANTRMTRLFGLLAIHAATGLDLVFLPWLHNLHLDIWPTDLGWFNGFMQISMPITLHLWVPQNMLGLAVVGLIYCQSVVTPKKGFPQAIFVALLLVALFRTSTFVFIGVLPGLALWHLYELMTSKDRIRLLGHLAATALIAIAIVFPFLSDALSKRTFLEFGLRSFEFLDVPVLHWLAYPITASVYLFLELGILLPLLLWVLLRSRHWVRPLLFWIFVSVGLLFPFVVQTKFSNDIAMRGIMPAQFAAAIIGCYILTKWEYLKKGYVYTLVTFQLALSIMTVGSELFFRYTGEAEPISATSRWIAQNTPTNSLIFYEQGSGGQTHSATLEENYGQRLAYFRSPLTFDFNFTPVPFRAWRCPPEVNLYDANSLCSIEAHIPEAQPVYVRYLSPAPSLDADSFTLVLMLRSS